MIIKNYREIIPQVAVTPEISSLLQRFRQQGVGQNISRQQFQITDAELKLLQDSCSLWMELIRLIELGAMARADIGNLQHLLVSAKLHGNSLRIISVFCPSYKIGDGQIGYTGRVGNKTLFNIQTLQAIRQLCLQHGIGPKITVYFSDLILENYASLAGTSYVEDLRRNFLDLRQQADGIEVLKLSSLADLKTTLGETGRTTGNLEVPDHDYQRVLNRNAVFYADQLGWDLTQVEQRTRVLALSYPIMARALHLNHRYSLCYWSESAWERSNLMVGLNMPIIFPKHENP